MKTRYLMLSVAAAAVALGGCAGGAAVRALSANAAREEMTTLTARSFARSSTRVWANATLVGRDARPVVQLEEAAAASVESQAPARAAAVDSARQLDDLAERTARSADDVAQIKACARAGMLAGARAYASNFVTGDDPPPLDATIVRAAGGCLSRAFPGEAPAVRALTRALLGTMSSGSDDATEAPLSAQEYVDWLVYTGSLYAAPAPPQPVAAAEPTGADRSVEDLLVVLLHSHEGRMAAGSGDTTTAIANRREVLDELDTLAVADELEDARDLLIGAMRRSLDADIAREQCGDCAVPYDEQASDAKEQFVAVFDPYVLDAYGAELDPTTF